MADRRHPVLVLRHAAQFLGIYPMVDRGIACVFGCSHNRPINTGLNPDTAESSAPGRPPRAIVPVGRSGPAPAWLNYVALQWRGVDGTLRAPRSSLLRIATGRDAADTAFLDRHHLQSGHGDRSHPRAATRRRPPDTGHPGLTRRPQSDTHPSPGSSSPVPANGSGPSPGSGTGAAVLCQPLWSGG